MRFLIVLMWCPYFCIDNILVSVNYKVVSSINIHLMNTQCDDFIPVVILVYQLKDLEVELMKFNSQQLSLYKAYISCDGRDSTIRKKIIKVHS